MSNKDESSIQRRINILRAKVEKGIDVSKLPELDKMQYQELLHEFSVYNAELLTQTEELIQTESEKSQLEDWFKELFYEAPSGYIVIDDKNNIIRINHYAKELFELDKDEQIKLLNLSLFKHYQTDKTSLELKLAYEHWLKNNKPNETFTFQYQKSPDKYYQLNKKSLDNHQILVNIHDVSETKQLEKQLKQSNKTLEIKVQEAENAQSENKEKSMFLANMSHELRTPMHAIMSFASLALKKIDNPQRLTKYLNNIRTSGIRLTNLLNDLLDISKLEAGKMTAHFKEQDITTLIEHASNDVFSLLQDKNISLNYNSEQHFECMIDTSLMMQVMINLLSNAIKFSPENSSIDIEVEKKNQLFNDKQQNIIEIIITDKGCGIPKDELDSVFDKFIQSSKTNKGSGGTGLGLSITKEIIDLHHGKIWAESPPPERTQGTAFFINLPILQGIPNQISFTNIQDAINSHKEWVNVIEEMYQTKEVLIDIPNSVISNENLCSLGQWINSGAITSNKLDELKAIHKEFHLLAGECVAYCEMGNYAMANQKRDEFKQISNNIILMLEDLKVCELK